jgi:FHS family L-fucose permease-like MFS transporter
MKHQLKPLLIVACVFLFTGSIICMNDILLPALKDFFNLTYLQASYVQQSFFLVYLIFPIPIAWYISRVGYKLSVFTALIICSLGSLIILPAYYFSSYILALTAIFVVSIGVAVVNVAANPMAALLGDPSGSHVRVNIVQLFSRIGYLLTPVVGTGLIYGKGDTIHFHVPYLVLGAGTILFSMLIFISAIPSLKPDILKGFSVFSILKESRKYPQLFWGAIVMFFYMALETGTAGYFISFLRDNSIAGFSVEKSARFLTYYYVFACVFALTGVFLLQVVQPSILITFSGVCIIILYLLTSLTSSSLNPYFLVGIGAFMAIMFPTIFSLGIEGLGSFTEKGSALLNMAIIGGAVGPPVQGLIADTKGIQISYLFPAFCAVLITAYGVYCYRRSKIMVMR